MRIKLSNHFSYGRLLRFTVPSIVMMIFSSIYGVVDGFFVGRKLVRVGHIEVFFDDLGIDGRGKIAVRRACAVI